METDALKPDHEDLGDIGAPASPKPSRINLNDYKGYEPPLGVTFIIDRVSADVEPKEFFEKYISARRPVIIEQHFKDCEWKGLEWNNKYLNDKAGDVEVLVEKRGTDTGGMFGLSAPKVSMKYKEFLEEIEKGSEQYYLTTQDLERFQDDLDDFDMPKSVLAEPLKSLKQDFPLRPNLLGKLIPYQVSLWQGHSNGASSSGLHHDFHDNLYVLIRGRKRFRIFPPSGAPHMSTMGRPIKIHTNGLIVYQSQPVNPTINVRADGVPLAFLARQKRIEAEQELAAAEEEMYSIQDSTDFPESAKDVEIKRLQGIILDCEDRIDLAMEEMLQYGNTFDYDYRSDEDVISVHDDESELDNVSDDDNAPKEVVSQSCQNEDEGDRLAPPTKVMRLANGSRAIVTKGGDSKPNSEKIEKIPDHFCNVVLPTESDDAEDILLKFAEKDRIRCLSVVIKSGEMLYLPASWFHEVSSYSDDSGGGEAVCSDSQGHLALNYWLFPPDGDVFDFPYRDDFWPKRWQSIQDEKTGVLSTSRHLFPLPVDSSEIISLDSDSDEDESDEDSDDDDDDDAADAIVVGDDSLLGSSDESDEPIVIESQASTQKTCNNSIEINSSLDVSISGNFPNNDKLDGADVDSSVSDGILDGSDEEDLQKAADNDHSCTDTKDSSEIVVGAESRVSLALECPDLPNNLEDAQNSEVADSRNSVGSVGKTNYSDMKSNDECSKTLETGQSNNLSSVT